MAVWRRSWKVIMLVQFHRCMGGNAWHSIYEKRMPTTLQWLMCVYVCSSSVEICQHVSMHSWTQLQSSLCTLSENLSFSIPVCVSRLSGFTCVLSAKPLCCRGDLRPELTVMSPYQMKAQRRSQRKSIHIETSVLVLAWANPFLSDRP